MRIRQRVEYSCALSMKVSWRFQRQRSEPFLHCSSAARISTALVRQLQCIAMHQRRDLHSLTCSFKLRYSTLAFTAPLVSVSCLLFAILSCSVSLTFCKRFMAPTKIPTILVGVKNVLELTCSFKFVAVERVVVGCLDTMWYLDLKKRSV